MEREKQLIFISGTMGVGKTAVSRQLVEILTPSVFLDGDWCWDMHPFTLSEAKKEMVLDHISYLLRSFLRAPEIDYVVFCWVMHEKAIVDEILRRIGPGEYRLHHFTLMVDEAGLRARIARDVAAGVREQSVWRRALPRLGAYAGIPSVKIDTRDITPAQAAERIAALVRQKEKGTGISMNERNEQITFTPVERSDQIETLAKIAEEVWHEHFISILSAAQIDYMVEKFQSAAAITRQITREGYTYYFICYKQTPIGYIGIRPDEEKLFLSKLYLLKAYRGHGYASRAFAFLEELCRERGYRSIWLTVNRFNSHTIAVYRQKGFQTVRAQAADIGGGFVMDDYVMEKTLAPSHEDPGPQSGGSIG